MKLVDNLYIGHDAAQAKKFAEETYHVKKPIEKEAEGSNEDELEEPSSLVEKVQLKVYEFLRRLPSPTPFLSPTSSQRADNSMFHNQISPLLTLPKPSSKCPRLPPVSPLPSSLSLVCFSPSLALLVPPLPRLSRLP